MLIRAWMRSSLCRKIGRTLSDCFVAVAAFDDLLVFVEPRTRSAVSAPGWLVASGVDAVGRGGGVDRGVVARVGQGRFAGAGAGA